MLKKIYFIFLLAIFFSSLARANSFAARQGALAGKIDQLTASYESKVGMAFIDLKSGWQRSVNGTEEFPTASVIKVAVMATAYHLAELGELDLNEKLTMKESDRLGGSGVLQWMKAGRSYTVWNLCRMMIVLSDNSATKMLVDRIGRAQINNFMQELELKTIILNDRTMLVEPPSTEVNVSSPLDMAYLLQRIKEAHGFSINSSKEMLKFMRNQRYRWGIWRGVGPGTVIADKTGNLEGILNDVGVVYTSSGNYILSVFTRNIKKRPARLLINEISRITYEEYTGEKVQRPVKAIKVKKIRKFIAKRKAKKPVKAVKAKKTRKIILKQKLPRRPSVKSRPRSGHRGAVLNRKSPSSLRQ